MSKKHSYLIICHEKFSQLICLLRLLDDYRNDIYIHIDKKCISFPVDDIKECVKKSKLFIFHEICVNWGGYSQIAAEIFLLKKSTKENYDYYHLLSGVDLPLKTQDYIHLFFDENYGKNFIHVSDRRTTNRIMNRLKFYHFFSEYLGINHGKLSLKISPIWIFDKFLMLIQRIIHIDRLKNERTDFYSGSQWFSITHQAAIYILSKVKYIKRIFSYSRCADEFLIQTLIMNSSFSSQIVNNNLRMIDWKRGSPYIFRDSDFYSLVSSNCLFARKFDESVDKKIIQKLSLYIKNG